MKEACREPLPSRSCVRVGAQFLIEGVERHQHLSHFGDGVYAKVRAGSMRRYTSDLEFQPDEAAMRDADGEFCRLGDQNSVRGPAFPLSQQGFRADAAVFFIGYRADDDITRKRHVLRRFQSQ